MTRTVMPGSGPVRAAACCRGAGAVPFLCARACTARGSLTRQPRPVRQRPHHGQVHAVLDPPQQVRAGRGGRVPQPVAVEPPVGQQQHPRPAGCPAARRPGPARRFPCRAPARSPRPAGPGCRRRSASTSRSCGLHLPGPHPAGRLRWSRAGRTQRCSPRCRRRLDGGPVPRHGQQPADVRPRRPSRRQRRAQPPQQQLAAASPRSGARARVSAVAAGVSQPAAASARLSPAVTSPDHLPGTAWR